MDVLDLGKIPRTSIEKVRSVLRASAPKAMSIYAIRMATTIQATSIDKILRYLEYLNESEIIETTGGEVFWRWRRNSNGD